MLATVSAPALIGIHGQRVTIECDITNGLPGLVIVGLGDKAVEEARERIRSAIKNSGFSLPAKRITLSLAPASLPKDGSGYDLGMALAILAASGQIDPTLLDTYLVMGELALNGQLKPTRGLLIAADIAATNRIEKMLVPAGNLAESAYVSDLKIFGAHSLLEAFNHLSGYHPLHSASQDAPITFSQAARSDVPDLAEIYGQHQAKRAVEIAAAGGHNLLLSGPPGTGKTLLAKSILKLMPPLTAPEAIEITKIYSLAEHTSGGLVTSRPFRTPHHSASAAAMIGGGPRPKPGEISLSHGGVLLLDEIPEFPRGVLEVLRQPLEDGAITISRASGSLTFPARFMLVATANPCPCGYFGDPVRSCECSTAAVNQYQRKLSGPLLDRIDLTVGVERIDESTIIKGVPGIASAAIEQRIYRARQIQAGRFQRDDGRLNAHMINSEIKEHCKVNNEIHELAIRAMQNLGMSARGYFKALRVARTIADLDESSNIQLHHFTEAIQYRLPQQRHNKPALPQLIKP